MGSHPMFHLEECELCGAGMPPCYPYFEECEECNCQRMCLLKCLFINRLPLKLRGVDAVFENVAGYLTFSNIKARRLYFLRMVLLARGSYFRKFTYFWNGLMGNIDMKTDVMDYVMRFL